MKDEDDEEVLKPKSKWTDVDKSKEISENELVKKNNKAMMAIWSDSDSSHFDDHDSEEINAKTNLCLMANDHSSDDDGTYNSKFNISYKELEKKR
ncbi:hypothetical protein REPUB_Repub18cG0030200 [Reevesia pubescens]